MARGLGFQSHPKLQFIGKLCVLNSCSAKVSLFSPIHLPQFAVFLQQLGVYQGVQHSESSCPQSWYKFHLSWNLSFLRWRIVALCFWMFFLLPVSLLSGASCCVSLCTKVDVTKGNISFKVFRSTLSGECELEVLICNCTGGSGRASGRYSIRATATGAQQWEITTNQQIKGNPRHETSK